MDTKCPYRGLQPLTKDDHAFFAGRDKEVRIILSNIYGAALTVLYGESGVGKTSLIWAGVLPDLEKDNRVAAILFRDWQGSDFEGRLRNKVLESLRASINRARAKDNELDLLPEELENAFVTGLKLGSRDDLYTLPFHRFVQECSAAFYGKVIFIFDQFEEYIYYHPLKGDGDRFDSALATAINDRQVSASFLLSLREDGLGKLDRLRGRISDLLGNIVRLEHLDQEGARRAIERPLEVFSQHNGVKIEAEKSLKDTLLDQIDADELDLDEASEAREGEGHESDSGKRYKAVALQAVLTQLWEAEIEPALSKGKIPPEGLKLTLAKLRELTEDRKDETEVRYLVRTYFDQKLSKLTGTEPEEAAEILRGLVRSGGHKRARSVEALARETTLDEEKVRGLLEKLAKEPFEILRRPEGSKDSYELNHDVMAFAIMDWSNRQRLLVREQKQLQEFSKETRRRRNLWVGGIIISVFLAAIIIVISTMMYRQSQSQELERLQERLLSKSKVELLERDVNNLLGLNKSPNAALLAAIDAMGWCFRNDVSPPPEVLADLRLAAYRKESTIFARAGAEPKEFIPALVSPDETFTVTVKSRRIPVIWDNRTLEQHELRPVGDDIVMVGLSLDGKRLAVATKQDVFVWDLSAGQIAPAKSEKTLQDELQLSKGDEGRLFKGERDSPISWKDYEELANNSFTEAIGMITVRYIKEERMGFRKLKSEASDRLFSERANAARELAASDPEAAKALLSQLLTDFHIQKSDPGRILANMYVTNARLAFKASSLSEAADYYRRAEALDPKLDLSKIIRALEYIAAGNVFAAAKPKPNFVEAAKAYKAAAQLDDSLPKIAPGLLKSATELEKESTKNNIPEMERLLALANEEAKAGHHQEAIKLYTDAINSAPDVLKNFDAEGQYNELAPKGPEQQTANPPASPPPVRRQDG